MENTLDTLFNPRSIAIVGATDKKEKVGYAIFKNIIEGGYKGKVYPVNRRIDSLEGYRVYHSITEIPDEIDLAIISIPIQYVPQLFDQLGEKGVKAAVVISAGGRETGEDGKKIEEEILRKARMYGIRFLGPNCLGFANTIIDLNANFGLDKPLKGKTAFISQSGALFTAIMDWANQEQIGFSYAVSIGNMADIDFGDLIDYLGGKDEVETILIYMESLPEASKFASSARRVIRNKPVIVAKAGRSETGQKAAVSHTGAIAGKDFLYSALFKRTGVVRSENVLQLFDLTEAFSKQPVPSGNRFVVVTNAGGPGVMAADQFDRWGIKPATLSRSTMEKLSSFLPPVWSHNNPVDIIGDASPERYRKTLEVLFDAREVDGIICILTPQYMTRPYETAQVFHQVSTGKDKPFYAVLMGGEKLKEARYFLETHGVPVFDTPEEAVDTAFLTYQYTYRKALVEEDSLKVERGKNYQAVKEIIDRKLEDGEYLLTEYDTKRILSLYGIPVNSTRNATTEDEAVRFAREIGYPVVLKINSPDILHKSDAGCVITGISDESSLRQAYNRIISNARKYKKDARIYGVIVEEQVEGDFELVIGSSYDKIFRQYMMFGMGGTMVEFFKDVSFDFPPLSGVYAHQMVESTKIYRLLKNGFRDKQPVEIDKLVDILIDVSRLVVDFPQVRELDINPLLVRGSQIYAVDGRIRLESVDQKNTILV
ncbi:acetate--CoA ligase family protein [Persephonella sp.]